MQLFNSFRFNKVILGLVFTLLLFSCNRRSDDQHTSWMNYGGGADQSKYFVLDEINKSNVSDLEVEWFYSTEDEQQYQYNPIVVDTIMYVLAKDYSLVALHAETGKEIWIHTNLQGIARRGINYWESEDRKDRRLIFQMNNYLQAIDALTGKSILSFGNNGLVDLRVGMGRDPNTISRAQSGTPGQIFENLIILGASTGEDYMSTPGYIRAYNVITGKLEWTFHTIPQPGEYGYDTWPKDAYKYVGGVNVWGEISLDKARGIAYFPLGSPTFDYYGADRIGSNLFGNCILALDARTGKRIWHYQLVHHDLWDYDLTAAPQLITVNHDGKKIDAVAVATKHGFLFAFNRVTGEPLWPIEEREVPASDIPGEQAWPTQPFPTVLPPFGRQSMSSKDITPFFLSDEERAEWVEKIDNMQNGLFTPLSHLKETVAIPGAVGGANWGNTASNPEKGMVYVLSIDWPSFYGKMIRREISDTASSSTSRPIFNGQSVYMKNCMSCHGPEGSGAIGPKIAEINSRIKLDDFKQIVASGRGEMPSLPYMTEDEVQSIYRFLSSSNRATQTKKNIEGPVVASGGAPGGRESREIEVNKFANSDFSTPYPEGVEAPSVRYFPPPGWGLAYPYLISPPWSSITAYDLNKGEIKWSKPIGTDRIATEQGGKDTGVPRAQRNGMIVTSTGLVFSTAKDGKIRAFDADNGDELWSAELPMGSEGLPSLYEVNGRHYLAVCVNTPVKWSIETDEPKDISTPTKSGYIVFALPKK